MKSTAVRSGSATAPKSHMRCASQFCLTSRAVRNAIQGMTNASCFPFPRSVHRDSPIVACYCTNATARMSYEHEFLRSVISARYRFGAAPARLAAVRISRCIRLKGPRDHALWIWPTHCAHFRVAAARGHVVSSRVPTCPCPVSGFPRDTLGSRAAVQTLVPLTDGGSELSGPAGRILQPFIGRDSMGSFSTLIRSNAGRFWHHRQTPETWPHVAKF